jgi:hypothetical protein
MGLKEQMDKMFEVDEEKIGKMASVDIATGGQLPLPEKGESVNVRILRPPRHVQNEKLPNQEGMITARCVIYGKEDDLQYDLILSSTIYKGMLAEFKKNNIPVDSDLKCIVGRIFTIAGREWTNAPKDMWRIDEATGKSVPPKTYSVALRLDLEQKAESTEVAPEGTAPELMMF